MLYIFTEVLSCVHAKGGKGLNDFEFDAFIGRFPSGGAASLAVKGLISCNFIDRVQGLCESRGGRPGLSVLTSLMVSVDVKQY